MTTWYAVMIKRFHGEEIDATGDGFFALFDGPARAIRCAMAIRSAVEELGLEIRIGVHTGEVDVLEVDPLEGSQCTRGPGSAPPPKAERCWFPALLGTWSLDPGWRSPSGGNSS